MDPVGDGTVLVIAKAPEPGRVKTRLCPPCTSNQAASIAAAALQDTFAAIDGARPTRRVVALDGSGGSWIPGGFEVVRQCDGGLGERLDAAFRWVERTGDGTSPMMVLGMDTPQVSAAQITDSLRVLRQPGVDAVLGPAPDGGYWTIGFTADVVAGCRGLFDGVPMSTPRTAEAQLATLGSLGLECRVLGSVRDIDTWSDALAVTGEFPGLATSAAVIDVLTGPGSAAGGRPGRHRPGASRVGR